MSHATKIIQAAAGGTSGLPDGVASFQLTTSITERGFEVASNGSLFYVPNYNTPNFHVYDMSTPYDVTSASRNVNKEFTTPDSQAAIDLAVRPDGIVAWTTAYFETRTIYKYSTTTAFDFSSATVSSHGGSSFSNGLSWGDPSGSGSFYIYRLSTIREYQGDGGGFLQTASIGSNVFHATWADNGNLHIAGISPSSNSLQYRQASTPYDASSLGSGAYTSIELLDDTSLQFIACSYAESGDVLFVLDESTNPSTVYTFTKAYLTSIGMPF